MPSILCWFNKSLLIKDASRKCYLEPLFTEQSDVVSQDLMASRSRKIGFRMIVSRWHLSAHRSPCMKSMTQRRTAVTPLLTHWSYHSLAMSHGNNLMCFSRTFSATRWKRKWCGVWTVRRLATKSGTSWNGTRTSSGIYIISERSSPTHWPPSSLKTGLYEGPRVLELPTDYWGFSFSRTQSNMLHSVENLEIRWHFCIRDAEPSSNFQRKMKQQTGHYGLCTWEFTTPINAHRKLTEWSDHDIKKLSDTVVIYIRKHQRIWILALRHIHSFCKYSDQDMSEKSDEVHLFLCARALFPSVHFHRTILNLMQHEISNALFSIISSHISSIS